MHDSGKKPTVAHHGASEYLRIAARACEAASTISRDKDFSCVVAYWGFLEVYLNSRGT